MNRTPMRRRLRRLAALCTGVLMLAGCGFRGAYSFSLPGGADIGDNPYTVQVEFLDVLDLVQQSGVRVADVPVGPGRQDRARTTDWTALVTSPSTATSTSPPTRWRRSSSRRCWGRSSSSSPRPATRSRRASLRDHPHIPLARTNRNVEVEELLGALSLVLNGGGLAQLQTINHELGNALQGRESAVRSTLTELDTFIGGLDAQKSEINRALDSANTLAGTLAARTGDHRDGAGRHRPAASTSSTSSATCWCRCCRAWPGSATSARGSSTSPRPTPSPTCSCSSRS